MNQENKSLKERALHTFILFKKIKSMLCYSLVNFNLKYTTQSFCILQMDYFYPSAKTKEIPLANNHNS